MLPVDVVISHLPPDIVFGTSILPVEVFVINTLLESKLPATFPVEVFTKISVASQALKFTLPVLRLIKKLLSAITFFSVMAPVLPFEISFLHLKFVRLTLPVDTLILVVPLQFAS